MCSSTNVFMCVYLHNTRVCRCVAPRSRLIAQMQAEAHLHENKSRTEACLRLHSDCRTRMAFMVPAMVVTQATVLCNTEPTLFECGPSRTACLPACAWHYHTEWQLHHLLMMITGNMKEEEEKKKQVRSVAQSAPVFPKSLFLFSDRDDKRTADGEKQTRAHLV